jgi:hypothetical protein
VELDDVPQQERAIKYFTLATWMYGVFNLQPQSMPTDIIREFPSSRRQTLTADEINRDTAVTMVASLFDGLSHKLDLLSDRLDEHLQRMKKLREESRHGR